MNAEILTTVVPRHGVVTLFGYGIRARVDRGHLLLEDGIGADRRFARLPRVGHGLKRLVVVGEDGMISLAAIRWLADQDAAFVMLDRDGSVLVTTGPVRSSDARLRRSQALAGQSGIGLTIVRELISQKLAGQAQVAGYKLLDSRTAQEILGFRDQLAKAEDPDSIRLIESRAGARYWSAWHALPINFPKNDMRRVPHHWRKFGTRVSPLSGSPRSAASPANAILNYLYAVLESEARLAAATLGLDPGLGVLHTDKPFRDSLVFDLMEPVRSKVDAYLLDWITRAPLRRDWFFEQPDGRCCLMGSFAVGLSETAPIWGRSIAPIAEWVARTLSQGITKPNRKIGPATHLTQRHRSEAKGVTPLPFLKATPRRNSLCGVCGTGIEPDRTYCALCSSPISKKNLAKAARIGRVAAQSPKAQARRAATKRRQDVARTGWLASSLPAWLNNETYAGRIQPRLAEITYSAIASVLKVSMPYAADVRAGRRRPHPRHWQALAQLVGVSADA